MWDFETDPAFQNKLDWMRDFVREEVEPLDLLFHKDQTWNPTNKALWAIMAPLKAEVRKRGLWACHLPKSLGGDGFGQIQLALMNEILGRSFFAPSVFGTASPDTGNAEILAHFGTSQQKAAYLKPLLEGDIVSCFSMTEPQGGADPKQFTTRAVRQKDGSWLLTGDKWFSSNARWASFLIVLAVTDPDVPIHEGATLFVVPRDAPGVRFIRNVGIAFDAPGDGNEGYLRYENVRLTDDDILGGVGNAFKIAQVRLGGGRVHHAMRCVGLARRALDTICERALSRSTQGSLLADKQMVQETIADAWLAIEQFRLFVMQTAWKIDKYNDYKKVRGDISAAKNLANKVVVDVVSKAMHLHGSLGLSNEMPFGDWLWVGYIMGMADGPREVHKIVLAKQVLRGYRSSPALFPSEHIPAAAAAAVKKYAQFLDLPGAKSPWVDFVRSAA